MPLVVKMVPSIWTGIIWRVVIIDFLNELWFESVFRLCYSISDGWRIPYESVLHCCIACRRRFDSRKQFQFSQDPSFLFIPFLFYPIGNQVYYISHGSKETLKTSILVSEGRRLSVSMQLKNKHISMYKIDAFIKSDGLLYFFIFCNKRSKSKFKDGGQLTLYAKIPL